MIAITFIALSIACFSMAYANRLDQDIQNFDKETITDAINELEKRIIKIEQQLSNNNQIFNHYETERKSKQSHEHHHLH